MKNKTVLMNLAVSNAFLAAGTLFALSLAVHSGSDSASNWTGLFASMLGALTFLVLKTPALARQRRNKNTR